LVQCVGLAQVANIQKNEATQKIQLVHFVARGSTPVLKQRTLKMIAKNALLESILMALVQTLKLLVKSVCKDIINVNEAKLFVCRARREDTTL
jgi:hypothetical protein